jgi:hypothetical protein
MATAYTDPPGWWEYLRFRERFGAILDPQFYTLEWLDGEIWSGRMRLFSNADSAIIVSLKSYPTGALELHVQAATGNLQSVLDLIPQFENWARSMGCIVAAVESRPGWGRVMKDYEVHQVCLRKYL